LFIKKKVASLAIFTLLILGMLSFAFNIKPAKGEWTGTVYIRADGSIDPPDAPIITYDNITYTLTDNIVSTGDGIVVEKGDITLNGSGYTIQGPSGGSGVNIKDVDNITIRDCHIIFFQKGIYLLNSHNNKVIGNSLFGNEYGIYLVSSLNNSIVKNNMFENFWSIWLYASLHNTIFKNRVSEGFGIVFNLSSNNSVLENEILRYHRVPEEYGCYGIWFEHSSNNAIMKNTIGYTFIVGAYLYNSSNNIVTENNIMENGCGIDIRASSNNKIFHNNFVNNLIQVDSREGSVNTWDDDYPSGGNYWSDYAGIDLYSGPYQNETGSDGIGDTPYVIDENNRDRYPLMYPYGTETYKLTITTTTGGTTSPAPGTYTYAAGSLVQVTAIPYTNYKFDYWELDGANVGSANPYTVLMDKNHTLRAVFSVIPLTVSINPLSASILVGQSVTFTSTVLGGYPPYSYQWYLNNSVVSGAASNTWTFTPLTIGTYKVYLNVTDSSENVAISDTATITVAPQLTISISPMSASILVGQSVTFTSTTSGGYPPYTYQWFLNGNPVSGATSPTWTFTPTTSGIFYIHLKVTDDKGNTAQSDSARIAVATVPVGGYSIPIQNPTKTEPILPYIALIATLTIVLTKIRNKTKRRR